MKKWIYRLILIVCVGVFAFSAWNLVQIYLKKNEVEQEVKVMKEKHIVETEDGGYQVDWQGLQSQNADIKAWIYVPDCDISFPVVQTDNNTFYLDHSFTKEENYLGAIFMACENASDFSDDNTLIYGHSVDGEGGMFTSLKNYTDETFFKEHPSIYIFTPDGNYEGHVYTFGQVSDGTEYYNLTFGDQREEILQSMKDLAMYSNDVETDGKMVTLSTCDLDYGFHSDQRYVLSVFLEKTDKAILVK